MSRFDLPLLAALFSDFSLSHRENVMVGLSWGCIARIRSGELANEHVTVQVGSRLPLSLLLSAALWMALNGQNRPDMNRAPV